MFAVYLGREEKYGRVCMCQQHRRRSTVSQWYRVVADPRCLNGTVRREAVPLGGKQAVGPLSKTGVSLKPVLNWANVCPPNILRTVRRTMIRFLTVLLVRRTWFRQFDELYLVLNWLVMRCKLRPELAADAQQTV